MISSQIKIYPSVNRNNSELSFGISRMEEIYIKHNGQPDEPHRHNFYTVLLVKEAKGKHVIDFSEHDLADHQVYFISPGQVHQLLEDKKSIGFSLVFSVDFLAQNNIPISFIEDLHLFNDYGDSPPLKINEQQLSNLWDYAEEMLAWHQGFKHHSERAIGSLLSLFLISCNNLCSQPENPQSIEAGNSILKGFKFLVESHFHEWHASGQYADQLHISADHLNRTIKNLIGKTAKEYIQSRITVAAKRLLYFSELSVKEIAFELGFQEPANFNAFFKKCTGISPGEFKKKNLRR